MRDVEALSLPGTVLHLSCGCFRNELAGQHLLMLSFSFFSSEVFRLNLEQGRFLNSLQTDAV